MTRNTVHRRNRVHAADSQANRLIKLATEVTHTLRGKLSRPPMETPNAEVLLPVGVVDQLARAANEVARRHRAAVADGTEAATRLTQAKQALADVKRELEGARKRITTVEAELRRYKIAAGEDVA